MSKPRDKWLWARVRKGLALATAISPKLPSRGDGPFAVAIKLLSIADSLDNGLIKTSGVQEYIKTVSADPRANAQFVELFFGTPLKDSFRVKRLGITEYATVVVAEDDELGSLYFVEHTWGAKPEPSADFWYSPGFDFGAVLARLWRLYEGGIQVGSAGDKERPRYGKMLFASDPVFGSANARLQAFVERHEKYLADGVSRSYLLLGPQGVGKSTFATRVAQSGGKRVLRFDATGLTAASAHELDFVLEGLAPDCLIIDDVDRAAEAAGALQVMLATFSRLRENNPALTLILTANSIAPFDPAVIRPGRIDRIVEFQPPDAHERLELLMGYLREFAIGYCPVEPFVAATEGLTAAYLREVAIQLRHETSAEVLETIAQMQRLRAEATGGGLVGAGLRGSPNPPGRKT